MLQVSNISTLSFQLDLGVEPLQEMDLLLCLSWRKYLISVHTSPSPVDLPHDSALEMVVLLRLAFNGPGPAESAGPIGWMEGCGYPQHSLFRHLYLATQVEMVVTSIKMLQIPLLGYQQVVGSFHRLHNRNLSANLELHLKYCKK